MATTNWMGRLGESIENRLETIESEAYKGGVFDVPFFNASPKVWYGRETMIQFVLTPSSVSGQGGMTFQKTVNLFVGIFRVILWDDPGKMRKAHLALRRASDTIGPYLETWLPTDKDTGVPLWFCTTPFLMKVPFGSPAPFPDGKKGTVWQACQFETLVTMGVLEYADRDYDG